PQVLERTCEQLDHVVASTRDALTLEAHFACRHELYAVFAGPNEKPGAALPGNEERGIGLRDERPAKFAVVAELESSSRERLLSRDEQRSYNGGQDAQQNCHTPDQLLQAGGNRQVAYVKLRLAVHVESPTARRVCQAAAARDARTPVSSP